MILLLLDIYYTCYVFSKLIEGGGAAKVNTITAPNPFSHSAYCRIRYVLSNCARPGRYALRRRRMVIWWYVWKLEFCYIDVPMKLVSSTLAWTCPHKVEEVCPWRDISVSLFSLFLIFTHRCSSLWNPLLFSLHHPGLTSWRRKTKLKLNMTLAFRRLQAKSSKLESSANKVMVWTKVMLDISHLTLIINAIIFLG